MSPRNLGGRYRNCRHPRLREFACNFLRETARVKSNCARVDWLATTLIMRCGLKVGFLLHTVLSHENDKFYTIMTYPCFSRSVYFAMGSLAWWRFGLWSSGSSLVFPGEWWRDAPLVREFQMWRRRCKQTHSHWFRGRKMRFCWIWSTMSWKLFIIYSARPFSGAGFQLVSSWDLNAIFNTWLAVATACETQGTACDIEISPDMPWIGFNCILEEHIFSLYR